MEEGSFGDIKKFSKKSLTKPTFSKFRVYSEEILILNLDNLLVAANLNREYNR